MATTEEKTEELMSTEPCEMDSSGLAEGYDSTGRIFKRIRFTVPSNAVPCLSRITDVDSPFEHLFPPQTGDNDEDFESNEDLPFDSEQEMLVEEIDEEEAIMGIYDKSIEEIVAGICLREVKPLLSYLGCETTDHVAYKSICSHARGVAKLMLMILDKEDFDLLLCQKALMDQLLELSVELCEHKDLAAITNGSIDLEKYTLLRESHIGFLLKYFRGDFWTPPPIPLAMGLPSEFYGPETKGHEDIVKLVQEVMEECKGLPDDKKMHMLLEFKRGSCQGMIDAVLLDAWREIEVEKLDQLLDVEMTREMDDEELAQLPVVKVGNTTHWILCELIDAKFLSVELFCSYVTEPLQPCWLGKFSEDVLNVVMNANFRRRWQGQHFVSASHIFWALRQSKIAATIDKLCQGVSDCLPEVPAKHPAYGIYKYSREVANILDAEEVGTEHLALATVLSTRNLSKQDSDTQELSDVLGLDIVKVFLEDIKREKEKPNEVSKCMGDAERPPGVSFFESPLDSLVKWSLNQRQVKVE